MVHLIRIWYVFMYGAKYAYGIVQNIANNY